MPANATTVSDWLYGPPAVTDCVLVTETLVNTEGAVAVQISTTPGRPAMLRTRLQTRPAPEIVSVCAFAALGPSEAANATSTSPAFAVLKSGVVRAPVPSADTVLSTVATAATVTVTPALAVAPLPSLMEYVNEPTPVKPAAGENVTVVPPLIAALPPTAAVTAVTVSGSPFGSVSFASTAIVTGVPAVVVAASGVATGGRFGGGRTTTVTDPLAAPPWPSVIA